MSFRSAMCPKPRRRDLHGYPDKRRTIWPFRVGRLGSNPGSIGDEGGHPGPRPDLEHLGRRGRGRRVRTPRSESLFSDARWLSAVWEEPNRVQGEELFVAVLDDEIAGFVTTADRGVEIELINIEVARELQGRGVGTHLVRFVEERARRLGKRAVTLGTSRNAAGTPWKSFSWWQSRGYTVTGEEENEWTQRIGPGVREIRMRKDL